MGARAWTSRHRYLAAALLLAPGIVLGATGSAAAYWLSHAQGEETSSDHTFNVELQPTAPGPYQVFLPVPAGPDGKAAPLALKAVEGQARFGLVRTEHGVALSVRAEGPVRLEGSGPMPLRLSLDDVPSNHRQFRFWGFLGRDAAGPVLLKLEVRQTEHTADWERHVDAGHAILLQLPLQAAGWQVVKATHLFDFRAGGGYGDEFPRVALGAFGASLAGLYPPLGLVLLGWRRRAA